MARAARGGVGNRHRPPRRYAVDGHIGLQRHVEHMGLQGPLPVRAVLFILRVGIGRQLDHPPEVACDAARIRRARHVTVDAARLQTLHLPVQLGVHVGKRVHRVAALAECRGRVVGVVNEGPRERRAAMQVMTVRAGDQHAVVPVHLRLQEVCVLLVRFVRVDVVGPDVVFPTGPPHGRSLFDGIGVARDEFLAADARRGQFTGLADGLCIPIGRAAVALPPVMASATDYTRALCREVLGIDDEAGSSTVRNVLRPWTVTALAPDVDLVKFRIVVDVDFTTGIVHASHEELAGRLVLVALPPRHVAGRAHRLDRVVIDRRRRQCVVRCAVPAVRTD